MKALFSTLGRFQCNRRAALTASGVAVVALIVVFSQPAVAQNSSNCVAIVRSAQDAANRADWVIEGDVNNTFKMNSSPGRIDVSIENAKVLFEKEKSPKFFTAVMQTDSCFPNVITTLWGKAADKVVGKRMRFFGTKLTSSRHRRFFFIQPAEQAMPSMTNARSEFTDKKHQSEAFATTLNGWRKARSTEGHFSIEMPGAFEDITKGSGEQPAFMLLGTDQFGSTFLAVSNDQDLVRRWGDLWLHYIKAQCQSSYVQGSRRGFDVGRDTWH